MVVFGTAHLLEYGSRVLVALEVGSIAMFLQHKGGRDETGVPCKSSIPASYTCNAKASRIDRPYFRLHDLLTALCDSVSLVPV